MIGSRALAEVIPRGTVSWSTQGSPEAGVPRKRPLCSPASSCWASSSLTIRRSPESPGSRRDRNDSRSARGTASASWKAASIGSSGPSGAPPGGWRSRRDADEGSRSMLERPAQPGARERPVELDGRGRNSQQGGGLLDREPREVAQRDHPRLARVASLEQGQALVQRQDL